MKVIYHSALTTTELEQGSALRAVPSKALIKFQKESSDPDFDILLNGNSVQPDSLEVKIDSSAEIVIKSKDIKKVYAVKPLTKPISDKYASAYEQFQYEYLNKNTNELESITSGQLKLYAIDQCDKVPDHTELFNKLHSAFHSFKIICEKPKSHLKAVNEVRPIETVKRIGYESIPYLASHSEDWLAKTASGLKPARLFSRVEDDEYQIYENRVVKTLIDLIIIDLRKKETELKYQYNQLHGIIDSGVQLGSFGFDVSFQKAVNELTSAAKENDQYRLRALDLVEKLHKSALDLLKKYQSLRSSKLYRYTKRTKPIQNPLKETNILLMDKNYNIIFNLWKDIHYEISPQQLLEKEKISLSQTYDNYLQFCKTLCGYTAHVLNFNLEQDGKYFRKGDNLEISITEEKGLINLTIKDRTKIPLKISSGLSVPLEPQTSFESFYFDGNFLYWDNDIDDKEIDNFAIRLKDRESRGKKQADEKQRYLALKQAIQQKKQEYKGFKNKKVLIYPAVVELELDNQNSFKAYMQEKTNYIAEINSADFVIIALPKCEEDEQKIIDYAKFEDENILTLPLTMFDINSFRRIQNILLRIILTMETGKCPMCGGTVRVIDDRKICDNCNGLIITETICPNETCKNKYFYLSYEMKTEDIQGMQKVNPDNFYQIDSLYQYKDVIPMTIENGKIKTICPKCKH